jgi:hypothetical protein
MAHWKWSWILLAGMACLATAAPAPSPLSAQTQSVDIVEIGPQSSNLHPSDADGASGGRVNGIAVSRTEPRLMFAASEWGGIFRSTDAGLSWDHVSGHVPVATWDVKVDPTDAGRVYATSFYDGRVQSRAGINISNDGGLTWAKPASAVPPEGFCEDEVRREEPSAFGIAIDPAKPELLYVGTNCGLAISSDRGYSWRFVHPGTGRGASDVWAVVAHGNGMIDTCGDDGHRRSTNGGTSWTGAGAENQLPAGMCSLAVSPDEPHVLFAVVGTTIYESTNGGAAWRVFGPENPSPQGRIPFVAVNKRAGRAYDLWFGDVSLHRRTCETPAAPAPGGASRCPPGEWTGGFTRDFGGHDDLGRILFDPSVAVDACPILYSSDGGVYLNTKTTSPDCHSPAWNQPERTPRALWLWDFTAVKLQGVAEERIYFGNQDNGTFGTTKAGDDQPPWSNQVCCDGFNVAADAERVLSIICCWGEGRSTRLFASQPGMAGEITEIGTYPPGDLRSFQALDSLVSFGTGKYAVITSEGIFVTENIAATPVDWKPMGADSLPEDACGLQIATSPDGAKHFLYVKSGGCDGDRGGTLWRHESLQAGGTWQQVTRPGGGRFGIFAVDPRNPARILAADLAGPGAPQMIMTSDGGATWTPLAALSSLMSGNGAFRATTRRGPLRWTGFGAYPQPTLVAIDPHDGNTMLAASADAGLFLSQDGGARWSLLTDPNTPYLSGLPHIPRARHAHFDRDENGVLRLYVGTQGRGVWRIRVGPPTMTATAPPSGPPPKVAPAVATERPDRARAGEGNGRAGEQPKR